MDIFAISSSYDPTAAGQDLGYAARLQRGRWLNPGSRETVSGPYRFREATGRAGGPGCVAAGSAGDRPGGMIIERDVPVVVRGGVTMTPTCSGRPTTAAPR